MSIIARSNHIYLPCRSTNKLTVHQGAPIPSTLSGHAIESTFYSSTNAFNSLARLSLFRTPDGHLNSLKEDYLRGCVPGISTVQSWVIVFRMISLILSFFYHPWEAHASNSPPTKPDGYGWITLGGF